MSMVRLSAMFQRRVNSSFTGQMGTGNHEAYSV